MHQYIYTLQLFGLSYFIFGFLILQITTISESNQGKSASAYKLHTIGKKAVTPLESIDDVTSEISQKVSSNRENLPAEIANKESPSDMEPYLNDFIKIQQTSVAAGFETLNEDKLDSSAKESKRFEHFHNSKKKTDKESKTAGSHPDGLTSGTMHERTASVETQKHSMKSNQVGKEMGIHVDSSDELVTGVKSSSDETSATSSHESSQQLDTNAHIESDNDVERKILYKNPDSSIANNGYSRAGLRTRFVRSVNVDSLTEDDDDADQDFMPRDNHRYVQDIESHSEERMGMENCTDCSQMREMKRSYRMNTIKAEILRKLRLSVPPNISGQVRPSIPHIERLIAQLNEEANQELFASNSNALDDDRATPMSVILFAQPAPPEVAVDDSTVCWFPLHQDALHHTIVNATLGVYIRNSTTGTPGRPFDTYLLVHRLGPKSQDGGDPSPRRRIQIRRIRLGGGVGSMDGKWVAIDMKGALMRLIGKRETMYGLQIEAWDESGRQVAVVMPQHPSENLYRPYLEIHVTERPISRPRRNPERLCEEFEAERTCCRYPLQVDFREFGWDFVIVPRVYSAYYCSGECPYLFMQTNSHTGLTQAARRDGGGPCCTPRKVSSISMIYYDERMNIVYSKLPGMIVDSCGCS